MKKFEKICRTLTMWLLICTCIIMTIAMILLEENETEMKKKTIVSAEELKTEEIVDVPSATPDVPKKAIQEGAEDKEDVNDLRAKEEPTVVSEPSSSPIESESSPKTIETPNKEENKTTDSTILEDDCTAGYQTLNEWYGGFIGEFYIENDGLEPMEDWVLEFDFDQDIIEFWGADIISREENHYIVQGKIWCKDIMIESTLKLGFNANVIGDMSEPKNIVVR